MEPLKALKGTLTDPELETPGFLGQICECARSSIPFPLDVNLCFWCHGTQGQHLNHRKASSPKIEIEYGTQCSNII